MNTRQARGGNGNRIALGVLIVAVSLFCLLSDVGALAGVGRMVSSFFIGFFGLADYAYSVAGILVGLAVVFNLKLRARPMKVLKYVGLFAIGLLALHIYSSSANIIGADYGAYLLNCYNYTNTAGGMLFGIIAYPLMRLITTVGAISLVCVIFFVLAILFGIPFIKKNVTYTSAAKKERELGGKSLRKSGGYADKIAIRKASVVTEPAGAGGGGQGLFVADVEGDPLSKKSRKAKGADGYDPLYPNAMGNLEDEIRLPEKTDPSDKFSARGLARDILLNKNPTNESYERFSAAVNPGEYKTVGAPFSAVRRSELRNKLGIDTSENAIRENFRETYKLRFEEDERNAANAGSDTPISSEKGALSSAEIDFHELKKEQLKRFGEICGGVKPEFEATAYEAPRDAGGAAQAESVKREVVKPIRVIHADAQSDSIEETIKKAQSAVNQNANLSGLQGAVNRAITGEERPVRQKTEIEAEAYERPDVRPKLDGAPQAKIPRAFEDTAIDKASAPTTDSVKAENALSAGSGFARGTEIGKDSFGDRDRSDNGNNTFGIRPSASSQPIRGGVSAAQAYSGFGTGARTSANGELIKNGNKFGDAARANAFESAREAGKEAPPMSAAERRASEERSVREQKVRASRERGLQRAEQLAKKMESIDPSKERVTQVNIDQAISQAAPRSPYVAPPLRLLNPPEPAVSQDEDYEVKKRVLLDTLMSFNIEAEVTDIMVGPTFSLYTLKVTMPKGKTVGYLASLERHIAMQMEEESVRIIAPIPGRNAVGIEVPNKHRRIVRLSEIITSPAFNKARSAATFALGKNLYGANYVCDVNSLPHMLIAGATGAGKSCCINSIIISLLYKASPEDVRLILIDPKRVELSVYEGIPHLLMDEIICDVDKAIRALNWSIGEMNRRIEYLSNLKYRDIDEHNQDCEKNGFEKMPRIVIIVDELADLMAMGGKSVEESINRVARLARAVGIHLILATQRPSVDVISGTIKNNLPTRVAFKVTSGPDSRTILDANGADKLLGNGDLLYMTPKIALPERMQGAFISNEEVKAVVEFIKQNNESYFDNNIKDAIFKDKPEEKPEGKERSGKKSSGLPPELFEALRLGMESETMSISYLQRKLGLGWPKAAKIFDMMDDMGYIVPDEKDPKRKRVEISEAEFGELISDNAPEDEEE